LAGLNDPFEKDATFSMGSLGAGKDDTIGVIGMVVPAFVSAFALALALVKGSLGVAVSVSLFE